MPDDYTVFLERLGEIEVATEELEHAGVELPLPVAKELRKVVVRYMAANDEFFEGREEGASEWLQGAVDGACRTSSYALKFRFLFYSKFVRSVIDVLKKNKKLASEYITNYGEQSEKFSEIIELADTAKLPEEGSPKYQAACMERIGKFQVFLSNLKTKKGGLFPSKYAEPKIDILGVANVYNGLKRELFKNFNSAEKRIEQLESMGVKSPIHATKELYRGVFHHVKADKELSQGNGEEAMEKMQEAIYHSQWALFDEEKLFFLGYLREAKDACIKIKGHKTLASSLINNYDKEHSKNLHEITSWIEDKKWPDETPLVNQYTYKKNGEKLQAFLNDFNAVNLSKAIAEKREAKKRKRKAFWYKFVERVFFVILGAAAHAIVTRILGG